jgi:hypothetical protein
VGVVVEQLVALGVVMGMRGGDVSGEIVGVAQAAERLERLGVELDRHRRLGHGDVALADLRQVHVRVVRLIRREHGLHALEQRPAGIGGEAAVAPLPFLGVAVGDAVDEAAAVGDPAVAEPEAVQHGEAVEPVVEPARADLELRGRHAHQGAAQPGGQLAGDRQAVDRRLLLEAREAEPMVRRARLRHCRSHGRDCTV